MKLENKLKKWSLAKWKKELWRTFSLYVKIRDKYKCFTCGRKVKGINAQGGHFIPAGACGLELYFHEDNVNCQCSYCNLTLQGNQYEYGKRLGEEKVKELRDIYFKRNHERQYSKQDYVNLINFYDSKINECQTQKQKYVDSENSF